MANLPPKVLYVPELEHVKDLEELKDVLREYFIMMQRYAQSVWNATTVTEHVTFVVAGKEWQFIPVGDNFELQKKVSGTWTTVFRWKGA